MRPRCAACPVAAGDKCLGQTGELPVFCEWAASGSEPHRKHIVGRSALAAGTTVPHPGRDTPAWLAQVNTCLFRECRSGCQRSRCWAGYGDRWHGDPWGEVSLHQCRACQAGKPPRGTAP